MSSSNQIALASLCVSVFALVASILSVWYTRRSHLASTIPVVSAWITSDPNKGQFVPYGWITQETVLTGYVQNHSENVPLTDAYMRIVLIVPTGIFRRRSHVFCEDHQRSIKPKGTWSFRRYSGKIDVAGSVIYDGIQEFLAKDAIGVLKAIHPTDLVFEHYQVMDTRPITARIEVGYKPGLHGSRHRMVKQAYTLSPIVQANKDGELILTEWEVVER